MSQQAPTMLERRARALLRAYPADYRRDRAEEVIGTLLEATPYGRSFPLARDAWALIAGGVRARAARNRRLSAVANLRLGLLLGLSIFVGYNTDLDLLGSRADVANWPSIAVGALSAVAALSPWLGRRTAATAIVLPAAALLAYEALSRPYPLADGNVAWVAVMLLAMIALAALSGGPSRLPRSWLWLACVPLAALGAGLLLRSPGDGSYVLTSDYLPGYGLLVLAAVVACWLVTDARPAFGLVAAALLTLLRSLRPQHPASGLGWSLDAALIVDGLPLAIGLAIMLPIAWRLRRQAAPGARALEHGDL